MTKHAVRSVADIESLMDRNYATVPLTRNGKVLEYEVQSLHDSEIHAINASCKAPEPPKKKEMRLDERGKPMIDLKTKMQIYDVIIDDLDSGHTEKVRELERRKNLLMVVHGLRLDWGDMKLEDRLKFVSERFSSPELIEFISKILELGVVDSDVLDREKNESGPNEKETPGFADLSS
jgi:hypothetical protein